MLAALNNRALCHLKLGAPAAAVADTDTLLAQEPGNIKALLRRAAAKEALGQVGGGAGGGVGMQQAK